MKPIFYLSLLSASLFVACGSNTDQNNTDQEKHPTTLIDSLNKEVNEGHDLAMAKMGTIISLQKSAKHLIDSLQKLQPVNQIQISEIQKADKDLENIKGSMYNWMEAFDFELKNMDSLAKVQYLNTNLKRIREIDDSTAQLIDQAKKTLQL